MLAQRAQFGLSLLGLLLRLPFELWGLVIGLATFFLRRPAELHSPDGFQPIDSDAVLDMPQRVLTEQDLATLMRTAHRDGATLNDILSRDLCQAIENWNQQHEGRRRWKPIRVMVPVNLRTEKEEAMPAANVVGMVYLDRRPAWHASPRWLLKSITWEMSFIKRFRLALAFVRAITVINRIPGGLSFLTRANRCYATCVFSNLGRVLDRTPLPCCDGKLTAGGLTLESVAMAPPVRPHTPIGLACITYAGRPRFVLNYDRRVLSGASAEELFAEILRQVGAANSSIQGTIPAAAAAA